MYFLGLFSLYPLQETVLRLGHVNKNDSLHNKKDAMRSEAVNKKYGVQAHAFPPLTQVKMCLNQIGLTM